MFTGTILTAAVMLTVAVCYPPEFRVTEIVTGRNPLFGYYAIAPALDVAFKSVLSEYPALSGRLRRSRVNRPDIQSCIDSEAKAFVG